MFRDAVPGPVDSNYTDAYSGSIASMGTPQPPASWAKIRYPDINFFCAGHNYTLGRKIAIIGGQAGDYYYGTSSSVDYDPSARTFSRMVDMQYQRWYPTIARSADGSLVALGGTHNKQPVKVHEVLKPGASVWRALTGAVKSVPTYAHLYQLPGESLMLMAGPRGVQHLDIAGTGKWTNGPARIVADRSTGTGGLVGSLVVEIGGGASGQPPTDTVEILDLAKKPRAWKLAADRMAGGRKFANATILPNGTILITGGGADQKTLAKAVKATDLLDPTTGRIARMLPATEPRLYHSTAALLADGRVASCRGGNQAAGTSFLTCEIFEPPYLSDTPRPTLGTVPGALGYGKTFSTVVSSDALKVAIVGLTSVTHTFNATQRHVWLPVTRSADTMTVTTPKDGTVAPAGPYFVFALNAQGVPSLGKVIWIGS